MTLEEVRADAHIKQGNKRTGLLHFGISKMRFSTLRAMIILGVFKHHEASCCLVNSCQNKAFWGQWGRLGSTEAPSDSAGEAERRGSSEVC